MTVYVDPLRDYGWKIRGWPQQNCHMFTDSVDLTELHEVAQRIGMKKTWFQAPPKVKTPHYDLTASRREQAVACGAVEVSHREAVVIWRKQRQLLTDQQ